jgi:hypothetical protein
MIPCIVDNRLINSGDVRFEVFIVATKKISYSGI